MIASDLASRPPVACSALLLHAATVHTTPVSATIMIDPRIRPSHAQARFDCPDAAQMPPSI
jgi:hypothetical protein